MEWIPDLLDGSFWVWGRTQTQEPRTTHCLEEPGPSWQMRRRQAQPKILELL